MVAIATTPANARLSIAMQNPCVADDMEWLGAQTEAAHRLMLGCGEVRLGVFARDAGGRLMVGASCYRYGTDLFVHLLWVTPSLRGTGIGAGLLRGAEAAGLARGMSRMFLSTLTFQAPRFYSRIGFTEIGCAPRMIHGNHIHYFRKPLERAEAPPLPAGLRLDVTDAPAEADIKAVDDGLTADWNRTITVPAARVCAMARDEEGERVGGCLVERHGADARILALWVEPAQRGHGLGRRLLDLTEESLRESGVASVAVIPHAWQAPDLFRGRGYDETLHIADFVMGHPRWWLRKHLMEVQ